MSDPSVANPATPPPSLDAAAARAQVSPWTFAEKVRRILWMFTQATLFRWSWHNSYAWRRFLLRLFGAHIGQRVNLRPTARFEIPWNISIGDFSSVGDFATIYSLGPVTIGRRVTISQHAYVCAGTHDYTRPDLPLLRPSITIHDDAWIAGRAFVGPSVTVGAGAILGACGVALKDLHPWTIYLGNPAQPVKPRPPLNSSS
jgi:putative colanic acid biosynthesis acetyltransferase WcaF